MKHRVIAVALIRNRKGEVLLCRKPKNIGVYPGQWALVGGGIEPEETMEAALKREVREEAGLAITEIEPLYFTDTVADKYYADGSKETIYMIYLVFDCVAMNGEIKLNEEFIESTWVKPEKLNNFDINQACIKTFEMKGWM